MTPIEERDKALSVIDPFMLEISLVYRECYLSEGKGALLVYADSVINGNIPAEGDYTTKNDVLEIIDDLILSFFISSSLLHLTSPDKIFLLHAKYLIFSIPVF